MAVARMARLEALVAVAAGVMAGSTALAGPAPTA
jgi:hypothetical protein